MVYPLLDHLRSKRVPIALLTGYDETFIPREYWDVPVFFKPESCGQALAAVAGRLGHPSILEVGDRVGRLRPRD
ncbi:hypothetical protein [Bradyrhizobium sp. USDA 4353]